jgi:carboxyl-terminal processing protease
MRYLKTKWWAAFLWAAAGGLFIAVGCVTAKDKTPSPPAPAATGSTLTPGANDARIAYITADLMENYQYSRQALDGDMSRKFYDGYIDSLDPRHENFLQSDLDEFAHYRTNMDAYIIGSHEQSDLTPAYVIFERWELRLAQHTAYVDELLKEDRFNFDTDERVLVERRHAPWPADMDAAKKLWRQWLLYDFLQERLGREISSTNSTVILPLSKNADAEIADKLEHHYNWTLQTITNWTSDNVLQLYLNALTHAYDPHSDYLNEQHAADFSINMSLQLGGIGAQLGEDDGYCTINGLLPGGPAIKSGRAEQPTASQHRGHGFDQGRLDDSRTQGHPGAADAHAG